MRTIFNQPMKKLPITQYDQSQLYYLHCVSSAHAAACNDIPNTKLLFPSQSARDDLQHDNENLSEQIERAESKVAQLQEHIKHNEDAIQSANEKATYFKVCSALANILSLCVFSRADYCNMFINIPCSPRRLYSLILTTFDNNVDLQFVTLIIMSFSETIRKPRAPDYICSIILCCKFSLVGEYNF